MENTYIYALIDPRNNLVRYIGKTNNIKQRYYKHLNPQKGNNTYKNNWINLLKKQGFKPEILILDEVPINNWQFWEMFYISLFKTFGFDLLNYTAGGDGSTFGNKGSWVKGNKPHNKGITHSNETKEKIRKKLTGTINYASYKPIIQYDINYNEIKRYNSIKQAVEESNGLFDVSKISACCRNKRTNHRGFIWKYDNNEKLIITNFKLLKKSVIQYDTNLNELNRYLSIKDASIKTGIECSNIVQCCKGTYITAGKFIWKYDDDNELKIKKNIQKKSVIQYDTNMNEINRFISITEAGEKIGINLKNISSCCRGVTKSAGGFIWKYETNL